MNTPRISRAVAAVLMAAVLMAITLAAALPQTVQAQSDAACRTFHLVREGETKPRIAYTYGLRWKEIAAANDMKTEDRLEVGVRLCIPEESSDNDNDNDNDNSSNNSQTRVDFPDGERNAVIQISITGGRVSIHTDNFNDDHVYLVKVRPADQGVGGWSKLGTIDVDEDRNQNFSFNVPNSLDDEAFLSVCLKDQATDELVCRSAVNP